MSNLNTNMLSFSEYFDLLHESFDTVSDFLLNPEHRDKTFSELMVDFKSSGGEIIGTGKYGTVFTHPSWPYVIKTFTRDDPYVKFVRYAYRNPNPAFPKFYGPPRKIVPFYTRGTSDKELYISRIEKLLPITLTEFNKINDAQYLVDSYDHYRNNPDLLENEEYREDYEALKITIKDLPSSIRNIILALNQLRDVMTKENWVGALDWHKGNVMKRSNGEYVLIDPLWEGVNPYAEADHAAKMEMDYYGYDYAKPEPYIRGGELPKKPRIKKPKPIKYQPVDDVPF